MTDGRHRRKQVSSVSDDSFGKGTMWLGGSRDKRGNLADFRSQAKFGTSTPQPSGTSAAETQIGPSDKAN